MRKSFFLTIFFLSLILSRFQRGLNESAEVKNNLMDYTLWKSPFLGQHFPAAQGITENHQQIDSESNRVGVKAIKH